MIVALIVLASILFVTVKLFSPPKFVMLAVVTLKVFAVMFPLTVIALKLPRLVILSNVPCANNPLNVPPTILPVTVMFCNPPKFVMFALTALIVLVFTIPDTIRLDKVPIVVIFGW